MGNLLLRAFFEDGRGDEGGRAGVEDNLVLLRRVWGAVRSSRPVDKYIKRHEVHHCYYLLKR